MNPLDCYKQYMAIRLHFYSKSYDYFKYNGKVMDIIDYDPDVLHIFSRDVLKKIINKDEGWEKELPEGIAEIIKEKNLFTRKVLEEKE